MSWWGNTQQYASNTLNDPPAVRYHGLHNQGATCYLNSVLQVLFMSTDFREAVKRSANENPELSDLFDDLESRPADTYKLTRRLGIDKVYEQRDAAEYLVKILQLTSQDASKIFHGLLVHKYICHSCGGETRSDAPFWQLPLTLNSSSGDYSVMNGITEFFSPSEMSGENQLYCESCDTKVDATFEIVMEGHPDVLVLLLKRFEFSYQFMSYVKSDQSVIIPYNLPISKGQEYELYAVVEHFGDLRSGHYQSIIKSQDGSTDTWYTFDDSNVTPLDYQLFQVDNIEKSRNANLLFYRKRMLAAQIDTAGIPANAGFATAVDEDSSMCEDPEDKTKKEEDPAEIGGPAVTQPVGPYDVPVRKPEGEERRETSDDEDMETNGDIGNLENERRLPEKESVENEVSDRFRQSVEISEDNAESKRKGSLDGDRPAFFLCNRAEGDDSHKHGGKQHAGEDMSVGRERDKDRREISGDEDGKIDAEKQTLEDGRPNIPLEVQISAHGDGSRDLEGTQNMMLENEDMKVPREMWSQSERGGAVTGMPPQSPDARSTAAAQPVTPRDAKHPEIQIKEIEEESREIVNKNSMTKKIEVKITDEKTQSFERWKISKKRKETKETEVSLGDCSSKEQQKRRCIGPLTDFKGLHLETDHKVEQKSSVGCFSCRNRRKKKTEQDPQSD